MKAACLSVVLVCLPALTQAGTVGTDFKHVVVIVAENHNFSSSTIANIPGGSPDNCFGQSRTATPDGTCGFVGNFYDFPRFQQKLSNNGTLVWNHTAATHQSIDNYFIALATGAFQAANNDGFDCPHSSGNTITSDSLIKEVASAGKTWKAYPQSYGSNTPTSCPTGAYVRRHNPWAYLDTGINNPGNFVDLGPADGSSAGWIADLNNCGSTTCTSVADLVMLIPDLCNDAHNAPQQSPCNDLVSTNEVKALNTWWKNYVDPIFSNANFTAGNDKWLIVFMTDEGSGSGGCSGTTYPTSENCGGHVALSLLGQFNVGTGAGTLKIGAETRTAAHYHTDILLTIMEALNLTTSGMPAMVTGASDLAALFN